MPEWRANRTQSALRAVGGKLILTDTELEFLPHLVDRALRGRTWSAPLAEIRSVGTQPRSFNPLNGGLRERLRIETAGGGVELFVVRGLDQVSEQIRAAAQRVH